jgi:multiple sugar transport system permease protein
MGSGGARMTNLFNYIDRPSPIHRLTGASKLVCLVAWSVAAMTSFYTPLLVGLTVLALILYSPSMTAGVAMSVVWRTVFLGNQSGIANYVLTALGVIDEPILWLSNATYIMPIVIIVALWSSMGVGFLAMLAGLLNVSPELYEAGAIDGVKNRFQEVIYITIPSMKPQMLFGAVMAVTGAFQQGSIGVMLTGSNPTPSYAAQLMVNHVEDYGFTRYEMGYAAAVSVALLALIYAFSFVARKLFEEKD